jgi:hypothetical protein
MSARHSPACAVVGSGNVAVLGGFDADDKPVGMDACLTFNISRSDAPGSILALLNVGACCAQRNSGPLTSVMCAPAEWFGNKQACLAACYRAEYASTRPAKHASFICHW